MKTDKVQTHQNQTTYTQENTSFLLQKMHMFLRTAAHNHDLLFRSDGLGPVKRAYLGLSVRLTRDFTMPGLILSARAPFSEIMNDFSFTKLCSFLVS